MKYSTLIKALSDEVSLVGNFILSSGKPLLWGVRLVNKNPTGPKAHIIDTWIGEGDLPSRTTARLGGFTATIYVGLDLGRHYTVTNSLGETVFSQSLT